MTLYGEVVSKVKELSQAEKRALLRVLADLLGEETAQPEHRHQDGSYQAGIFKPARDSTLFRVLCLMRALMDPHVILDVLFNREEGLLSPMLMLKI